MARYADAARCPDCGSPIPPQPISCSSCQLPLTGPVAVELYGTLVHADRLLAQLRSVPVATAPGPVTAPAAGDLPAYPRPVDAAANARPPRRGLSGASVPQILLTLGALCLLAAAITFLAVAWSWLGVGGRTAILVVLTALGGASTWLLLSRRLRGAAEALCVVTFGLLALDLSGAHSAGWFGGLPDSGLLVLTGLVIGGLGFLSAWLLRQRSLLLLAPEFFAAGGLAAVPVGLTDLFDYLSLPAAIGCFGLLGTAAVAHRLGLRVLPLLAAVGAGWWWLPLTGAALERLDQYPTWEGLWLQGHAAPMLASAAALISVAVAFRRHRLVAAPLSGIAATMVTGTLLVPTFDASTTVVVTTLGAVTAAWAVGTLLLPPAWRLAGAVPTVLLFIPPLAVGVLQVGEILEADLATEHWSESAAARLPGAITTGHPFLLTLVTLVACLVLVALSRLVPMAARLLREATPLLAAVVAYAVIGSIAATSAPRAVVVLALAALAAGLVTWTLLRRPPWSLAITLTGLATGLGAVIFGGPSAVLTAIAFVVTGGLAAFVAERSTDGVDRVAGAVVVPVSLAGLVASLGELGPATQPWTATAIVILLGALIVVRPEAPYEASVAVSAAFAGIWGALGATTLPGSPELGFVAGYLTIAGAFVVISSLVHDHRRELGWVGGALLAAASWVRLYDLDVRTPEAYTLPTATALTIVGLAHLRRHPATSTIRALGAGLSLATVPSLLKVLMDQPISLRALLLGLACLALVLGGTRLRWQGPLLVGAVVGAVLVLWETQPYAAQLPPWVPIALAGGALIAVGITWESRLGDLRRGAAYLGRLR